MEKPVIAKHVFKVFKKEYLSPHYIRVTLEGEGAKDFAQCDLGANNKIMVPPTGQKVVKLAVWDDQNGEWILPAEHERPVVRTYTHRGIDIQKNQITIDFVDHGDSGPASSWARIAEKGDELGVAMKLRPTVHYPDAEWYLLVGDATALPVLSVILESLPAQARGQLILEVPAEEDIQAGLEHPGFSIQWVVNRHPEEGSTLFEKVKQISLPPEGQSHFAYVACEYQTVKNLRAYFKEDLQWHNKEFYAFSYWKSGTAEDRSAKERRQEKM